MTACMSKSETDNESLMSNLNGSISKLRLPIFSSEQLEEFSITITKKGPIDELPEETKLPEG